MFFFPVMFNGAQDGVSQAKLLFNNQSGETLEIKETNQPKRKKKEKRKYRIRKGNCVKRMHLTG